MDTKEVLIGLFVLALVIIEIVNTVARNRGNATLWTKATEVIKEQQKNVNQSDLIEKAMVSVVPVEYARQQIIGGTQNVADLVKRLTPDDVDAFIDALTAYQKQLLDGQPNTVQNQGVG